ncbi:MAG: glycosyltransferase [Bacteroidota bacterium]|nr:glycosyltransferase [Bacteroidota bacterium]
MIKKNVIQLVTPYLFHTGSWIYSQLIGMKKYNPIVFTQKKENIDQFPVPIIVSAEEFPLYKRIVNLTYRKATSNFGMFFSSYINKYQPLFAHAHMGYEGARWLHSFESAKIPLITTFYGQDVSKLGRIPKWKKRYLRLFDYGTFFLAEGNYLKKQLVDIGCSEEKIVVQHLGVNIERYPQKEYQQRDNIIILQIASFREKKGIEYSLQAIAAIKDEFPNIEFRIIGSGDSTSEIQHIHNLAKQYRINDIVKFLGKKPHNEIIEEYRNADIFLHPSVTAQDGDNEGGSPVSITEASAVGLPIISTTHADIPEVVLSRQSGLLAPERDVSQLRQMLQVLIQDPAKRKEMGLCGRRHIEMNYNILTQVSRLEEIYSRLEDHFRL